MPDHLHLTVLDRVEPHCLGHPPAALLDIVSRLQVIFTVTPLRLDRVSLCPLEKQLSPMSLWS